MIRVNVGCGQTPTKGWTNFDNSMSIRLARYRLLPILLKRFGVIERDQYNFIQYALSQDIKYADATKGLPLQDSSVDVIYSSHMLEHLDQKEASIFLNEAMRVLCTGGVIRLVLPDLHKQIKEYLSSRDADQFVSATFLASPKPRTIVQRLKATIVGPRCHQWMYDGASLSRLLQQHGFSDPKILQAGETGIVDPSGLDLNERSAESLYLEAKKI